MTWKMDPAEQKDTVQGGRGHCKSLNRKAIDAGLKEVWRKDGDTTTVGKDAEGYYFVTPGQYREYFDTLSEAQSAASYYRRNN